MKIFLLAILLVASQAKANFLPQDVIFENDGEKPSNISQSQLEEVTTRLQNIYTPIVASFGGELQITSDWGSKQVNAFASRMGSTWKVNILGGLVRHPDLTIDGLTLVVCHELGHHLAGYPYALNIFPFVGGKWAANEGASDYFATQSCGRKVWAHDKVINAEYRTMVSPFVKTACDQSWSSEYDQNLCYRISAASQSLGNVLAKLMKKPSPKFETPDKKVVMWTSSSHPNAQCRLDTYFQGSLCKVNFNDSVIPGKKSPTIKNKKDAESDAYLYSCGSQDAVGRRPNCWFKAKL